MAERKCLFLREHRAKGCICDRDFVVLLAGQRPTEFRQQQRLIALWLGVAGEDEPAPVGG
jgi:hypothetical protein